MRQFTYRIPPCPWYDIKSMELWLEEMASGGLFLGREGIVPGLVAFEKGSPKTVRYRLIASTHPYRSGRAFRYAPVPNEKTQAFYREFGWEYIATRRDFHIYVCDDPTAPEMDTDPRVQALAFDRAAKRQVLDIVCYVTIALMYLAMFVWDGYEFLLGSRHSLRLSGLWLAGMWLLLLIPAAGGFRQLRRQQKLLEAGSGLPEKRTSAPLYFLTLAGKAVLILSLVCSLFLTSPLVYRQEEWVPLTGYTEEIPLATMEDLLPEAQLREDTAWPNHILRTTNFFADTWQRNQQLHITLPDGTETSGTLRVTRRETNSPSSARRQARAAFSKGERRGQNPTSLSIDGTDLAFYFPDRAYDCVVLQRDNTVLTVEFHIYSGDPLTPEQIARVMAKDLAGHN